MDVTLLRDERDTFLLPLRSLSPLHDLPGEGIAAVTRKIDADNLQSLLYAEEGVIPPILVQKTSRGYVIVDGHHRYQRAYSLAARLFAIEQGMWPKENGEPAPPDLDTFKKVFAGPDGSLRDFTDDEHAYAGNGAIVCTPLNAPSMIDLVRAAWKANATHGMPVQKSSARGRYGLWLYQYSQRTDNPLSYAECAREAGCGKAAIVNYAARHAGDTSLREGDLPVEPRGVSDGGERAKNAKALAKAMTKFYALTEHMNTHELALLLSEAFRASEWDVADALAEVVRETSKILVDEYKSGGEE